MAKKSIASLRNKDAKGYAKVIKAVKTKSGAYSFREEMVTLDNAKEALKK